MTCQSPTPPRRRRRGGAGGGGAASGEALEIVGTYRRQLRQRSRDHERDLTNFGVYNISQFDNEARYVIAQNDEEQRLVPLLVEPLRLDPRR